MAIVNAPVTAPAAIGWNCTLKLAVWPGFKVRGKLAPDSLNPVPLTVAELTVTGAVPVEDKSTD